MDTNQATSVVGSFRKFGAAGPVYEVVKTIRDDENGHRWMQVHIFNTDEYVEYKLADVLDDPLAD